MQNHIAENAVANPPVPPAPYCWHVIASEYPPQSGGVGDYTNLLAAGLAECSDEVHVWCPERPGPQRQTEGVVIHGCFRRFSPAELRRAGTGLDAFPKPRRLLVQWVPHGFGYRSMNLAFCWWLWTRAAWHGDRLELMVHEPFLRFRRGSLRQNVAALTHRLMTTLLLRAADHVWLSIPGWEPLLRPYAFGRHVRFQWLPIFSNVPIASNPGRILKVRQQYARRPGQLIIGHFGTFHSSITDLLEPILLSLASGPDQQVFLLMGQGSERFRDELVRKDPRLDPLVAATGKLPPEELSAHLAACDLLIQPYPDGVSSRRTSFMAGLAHGKPMVTTTGEFSEALWSQAEGVFLAPPGHTQAFVENVRKLVGSPAARSRAGDAARRLYQERFDSSHIIATLRRAENA